MTPTRFRRRPTEVLAIRWSGEDIRGIPEFLASSNLGKVDLKINRYSACELIIDSDYGNFEVPMGDWLCVSVCGQVLVLNEGQILAEWDKIEE